MSSVPRRVYSEEEYLEFENGSETRHEFYRGEIFAMTGASIRHNRIVTNIVVALGQRLAGTPCYPIVSTQRIKVVKAGLYTYPDLSVLCGPPEEDGKDRLSIVNPSALFEVLSPTTAHYDRNDKLKFYQQLATLKHYVIVWQDTPLVELHSRDKSGWKTAEFDELPAILKLPGIGTELPLAEIYATVTFDPPENREGGDDLPIHPRLS